MVGQATAYLRRDDRPLFLKIFPPLLVGGFSSAATPTTRGKETPGRCLVLGRRGGRAVGLGPVLCCGLKRTARSITRRGGRWLALLVHNNVTSRLLRLSNSCCRKESRLKEQGIQQKIPLLCLSDRSEKVPQMRLTSPQSHKASRIRQRR